MKTYYKLEGKLENSSLYSITTNPWNVIFQEGMVNLILIPVSFHVPKKE